jgi:hypothetical protein
MAHWIIVTLATLFPSLALASGWNDYTLPIDSGYEIVHCNSLDVVLTKSDSGVILMPRDYPGLGPINQYAITPSHIFTRHYGRTPRNLFAGDTFEDVDASKTFFCITSKADNRVSGPFSQSAFEIAPEVQSAGALAWKAPSNPNIVTPVLGALFFLATSAFMLGWPIAILLGVVAILVIVRRRRAHGRRAS